MVIADPRVFTLIVFKPQNPQNVLNQQTDKFSLSISPARAPSFVVHVVNIDLSKKEN